MTTVGKKVLVVDDEWYWQGRLKGVLEELGCQVEVASNFHEGMAKIDAAAYDMIVLDNSMQGVDEAGLDLLQYVRQFGPGPNSKTPIILHTGDDRITTQERVQKLGGIFHFKGHADKLHSRLRQTLLGRNIPAIP